jgi:hypothetical protein
MLAKEIADRLREHSGLLYPATQLGDSTFIEKLETIRNGGSDAGFEEAVGDVIACLENLNRFNNEGEKGTLEILNPHVVYSISGMMVAGTELAIRRQQAGEDSSKLLIGTWKIACAWDAVLAGDIDSISEHVILEIRARRLGL